jgi:hypothetical protein
MHVFEMAADANGRDTAPGARALALMKDALVLLDQAGLHDAAARLDHAICLVPVSPERRGPDLSKETVF